VNGKSLANHGECLSDECLTDYLEGNLDPVVRTAFESHLVVCDKCRENLALFMRILREDVLPHEAVALQELDKLWASRKLHPVPARRSWIPSPRRVAYAVAGVAAALIVAVLVGAFPFGAKPSVVTQLVAAMVTAERPFEPRVVGQPYMAIQEVTRAPGDPVPDVLAPEMTENSAEAYEVGRYFLLRKEYAKAIKYLKTAVEDPNGVPADVHNDLGVAYFQSGIPNIPDAESEFKAALDLSPTHAPALFNLSILYARLGRVEQANERRQQYLALDPDSGWAKEIASLTVKESNPQ
jgi:tetratricopeptide (TPR) repeat protein